MILQRPEPFTFNQGRVLSEEERRELEGEYQWPRPERKLCQIEGNSDKYRLGKR